jgi:hypothetical protein
METYIASVRSRVTDLESEANVENQIMKGAEEQFRGMQKPGQNL